MANTYPTTTLTKNILIADDLQSSTTSGTTTTKTQIVLTNSSCGLEMQSTTSGFVLPRMTTTQRNALTGTAGMQVYNSTTGSVDTYQNAAWGSGVSVASGTLTATAITTTGGGIYTAPLSLIVAPGAGYMIFVHRWMLNYIYNTTAFAAGGNIFLQYNTTGNAGGTAASSTIATALLTQVSNQVASTTGAVSNVASANTVNQPICITNATAVFTGGGASTVIYTIYYSILATS